MQKGANFVEIKVSTFFMATTEKYTTVIELNSEQAKQQLDELRKKVESWKSDLAEAREKKMGKSFIASLRKELTAAEKELKKYDNEVARTIDTMNNLQSASVENIEQAQKNLKRLAAEVPHNSPFYEQLNAHLDKVTQEMENIKATKAFEQMQIEATGATRSAERLKAELDFVRQTAENAETASVNQLQLAERTAQSIKNSAEKGSKEWTEASAGLEKVRSRLTAIEEEERKVVKLIDRYNKELAQAGKEAQQVQGEIELVDRTMAKLDSASVRDIEYSIKVLNEKLRDTERSGGNVEDLTNKLKLLNTELKKIQDMQSPDREEKNIFSRGIDFLNRNWGAITQMLGGILQVSFTIRKTVADYAAMEQEMANVRKYTGQTIEEVAEMNEMFKNIDTRTAREELNQLAGSAGRLGITATDKIMEFVDAADKINVALGDDLGKGAVDQIGKLAMAFGEDEKMGLRGAMLATGSAVNDLAQTSAANAGYLVEFTARVAGVGKQLGLTQAQIMGFGAVMDENMLRDEMASTAFSQLITAMATDAEKFSKFAGIEGKKFAEMVRTDINGAVLALADNIKKQDPSTMLKMFTDMGLDGSRAVGVLANMADKIDDVRRHQETANKAYAEGVSIQKEFEVQNGTVEAGLDKVKKQFKDMSVELGEKLMPIVKYTISGTGMLVKSINHLVDFLIEYRTAILTLTAATIIYNAALIKKVALQKLDIALTFAKGVAIKSLVVAKNLLRGSLVALSAAWALLTKGVKGYNQVMAIAKIASVTNPWTALAAVLTVVGAAVYSLVKGWRDHKKALQEQDPAFRAAKRHAKDMDDIAKSVNESTAKELATIRRLTTVIRSNAYSINERKGAIKQLQQIVPEYHASIDKEGKLIDENTRALDDYITNLKKAARAQAYMDKLAELERERLDNDLVIRAKQTNIKAVDAELDRGERMGDKNPYKSKKGKMFTNAYGVGYGDDVELNNVRSEKLKERKIHENALNDALSKRLELNKAMKKIEGSMRDEGIASVEDVGGTKPEGKDTPVTPYVSVDEEEQKKRADAAKAESDALLAAKAHEYATGKITYRQYIQDMAELQYEGLRKRRDAYEKGSVEYEKLNRQLAELEFKGDQQVNQMKLADLKHCMTLQQMEIETQAARGEISEQEKQERLRTLNETYQADVVELYKKGTKERMDAEWELEQAEQRNKLQREQYYHQQLLQIREQLLGMGNDRIMELELKNIEEVYDAMIRKGIAKEKEKQDAILAVKARYAGYQNTSERAREKGSLMLQVASDAAKKELDGKPGSTSLFAGEIMQYQTTMAKLKEMYGNDKQNHDAYLAAKQQATAQFCANLASQMQAAYNMVNQVMSAASSYFSAQQEYETAMVQKKYEKQIDAAGNNQQRVKKLQEKQQKEEAAIKTKYAKRAATIQMAQAVAQTAIAAINAYSSAAAIPMVGHILAPIAAAAAIAAGLLQIATIKKQQQAQEAGYYEGGYTGGKKYKREAGVVHEGEFVANHLAVNNPNVRPVLDFLDQAQRNNTVGSLTSLDVARTVGGGTAAVVTPVVHVTQDNSELKGELAGLNESVGRLNSALDVGIPAYVVIDGPDGLYKLLKKYEKLIGK